MAEAADNWFVSDTQKKGEEMSKTMLQELDEHRLFRPSGFYDHFVGARLSSVEVFVTVKYACGCVRELWPWKSGNKSLPWSCDEHEKPVSEVIRREVYMDGDYGQKEESEQQEAAAEAERA